MALSRCLENHSPPTEEDYAAYVKPIGYPNTSSICGREECENPGVIWLKQPEIDAYNNDEQRIFRVTNVVKMKADDSGVHK